MIIDDPCVITESPAAPSPEPPERFPIPPEDMHPELRRVFLPILAGLKSGMEARKLLIEMTAYCVELEIAVQEHDQSMSSYPALKTTEVAK